MASFENTVTIRRPIAAVFAFLADFENIPAWNYAIVETRVETRKVSPGPVGVGTTYRQIRSVPRRSQEGFEVTVFEPASRLEVQGELGPFRARLSYALEPAAGGTKLTNAVELRASGLLSIVAPPATSRVKHAVAANLDTLKQLLEGVADVVSDDQTLRRNPADWVAVPQPRGAGDALDKPPAYHALHPNTSLNFQLNRWLAWMTPEALPDVAAAAARVRGYADFKAPFSISAIGSSPKAGRWTRRLLPGRRVLPQAERRGKAEARRRFVELVREVYGIGPQHMVSVPFEQVALPAYRFGEPRRGTILIFGGFDSYVEEFFPMMLAMASAGYQVIGFEGPGQGGALEDAGLVLTPEWQLPVGAVVDYFGLDRVTIVGVSLGGGLAIRAAAGEPRFARVIADDVLTDFLACNLRQFPTAAGTPSERSLDSGLAGSWTLCCGEGCSATCSPTGASLRVSTSLGCGPRTSTLPRRHGSSPPTSQRS